MSGGAGRPPRILVFGGSTRAGAYSRLLAFAASEGARKTGAEITQIDLRDFPMPLFDEDLEANEGLPLHVKRLKELFLSHQGLLIATPEYNGSYPAVLKNAIDWVSRPAPGEKPLACFQGKVAGVLSSSPGALGGIRAIGILRALLSHLKVLVVPEQFALVHADQAFDESGRLKDERSRAMAEEVAAAVVRRC